MTENPATDLDEGDPDAPDPGELYEMPLEEDPAPVMNEDADDDYSDLPEGEDSDEPLDDDDEDEVDEGSKGGSDGRA